MATLNFVLDIFVKSFESPALKTDEDAKTLKFDATIINKNIAITSSRINVTDYNPNASIEFQSTVKKLQQNIEDNGITFKATFKGRAIGEGKMMFPDKFLEGIKEGMSDLEHQGNCSVLKNGEEVGKITFKMRIIIKCENLKDSEENDCRRNMDINQADIMFVVGEQKPQPYETCLDAMEPEEGDERLQLDLDRYKPIQKPTDEPPEEFGSVEASRELKQMTDQYGVVVDSLITKTNNLVSPMPDDRCLFIDWSGKVTENLKPMNKDRTIPIPIGDMTEESGIKPIRYCPVCLTPMSWLPKYATCPKCCTKPMPELKVKPDELPTANQVIAEYLKETGESCQQPCSPKVSETVCGCICKAGKMCLHCRMRLNTADLIEKKEDKKECPVVEPTSNEDFCVVVEEDDEEKCVPHLEYVFQELIELYNKKEQEAQQKSDTNSSMLQSSSRKSSRASGGQGASTSPAASQQNDRKTKSKERNNVPRRHGWAWSTSEQARKYGWKPGAISRYVVSIMKFFLQYPTDPEVTDICQQAEEQAKQQSNTPLLNICKQNGIICITLQSPDSSMKPITFQIVKTDEALTLSELKRKLKAKGFSKCSCHQPLMLCVCRETREKQQLAAELEAECLKLGMESCVDKLILTDTSESDMEYNVDVSPPTAPVKSLQRAKKPKTLNNGTQTMAEDKTGVVSKYPVEFNPYYRTYDCAAGDRYTGTAFGALGEEVFEDGVFGYGGGGAHGDSATPGGRQKPKTSRGSKAGGPMSGNVVGAKYIPGASKQPTGAPMSGNAVGDKSIPGASKQPAGKQKPIPVRMPARYYKEKEAAAQSEKQAAEAKIAERKKGVNLIAYLEKKGAVDKPWNPNDPQPKEKPSTRPIAGKDDPQPKERPSTGPVVGKDGLTDAQRARRSLRQAPIPPLDTLPRLGKAVDACLHPSYNPCNYRYCNPCSNYTCCLYCNPCYNYC